MAQSLAQPGNVTQFPSVGRWIVTALPAGWIYVADFGIRQMTNDPKAIVASVGLGQDTVTGKDGVPEYIEKQKKLIVSHLTDARFAGPQAVPFAGADEAHLVFIRHSVESSADMLHAQTYVRVGNWLGIVTLTTLEAQLRAVRPDYDAFVKGLHIGPQPASESEARS